LLPREFSQPKGWATEELLKEIGYSENEVHVLVASGAAYAASS
jgi:hypothetical protein